MVTVVIPTYNEVGNIEKLIDEVSSILVRDYEMIFIDDGSNDGSLELLKKLSQQNKKLKYLSFSRNFGHQAALRAGLAYAKGEAVISMDADMQHPPKILPKLISKWKEGFEIVYTIRKDGKEEGVVKRLTSSWFYKIMNFFSGLNIEEGTADFRLLDRKVVEVINSQRESDIFLRGYINWIGFRQASISYIPAKRFSGESKYTLKKMIGFASSGVTQFSVKPLRLAYILAVFSFIVSFIYVVYSVYLAFIGQTIPGWLSLVVLIVFLQGTQFMLLGMIGEYLGRTFIQTKNRPGYIVSETNILDKRWLVKNQNFKNSVKVNQVF